jgi:hypothetical protein
MTGWCTEIPIFYPQNIFAAQCGLVVVMNFFHM